MASSLKNLWGRVAGASSTELPEGFTKAPKDQLFPATNPAVDGEDCLHDCETCTIKYPKKWSIDEDADMYGHIEGWQTHLVVATGKTDWVRDVADEAGSIMQAVEKSKVKPANGKMMISASNMPVPDHDPLPEGAEVPTTVLLLPSFTVLDNVTPSSVPGLITNYVNTSPTNTMPLNHSALPAAPEQAASIPSSLKPRNCPHDYIIMLCSHKTRDARCGQSAPLLRREFERQLRPLGLYRDLHDERPGGVGIYFINHVGGHKFAANVLIYRRVGSAGVVAPPPAEQPDGETNGEANGETNREAAQCIWLGRVRPSDCENLVKYTLLQGKLVKPGSQLRGGFDRGRQLVSW
ncbi:uncharacterized protein K452DRAFT_236980 [Aplosporella prunicola CBS 121167]|uniref:Uncharacterized protein n=1 Tax=Aplosporella prunicola CBS 121167 TaxID=1176127 RepID=A0A6A6B0H1_9PEZI|nr:uncharacterized protein K452DRAFT_236980 [Aplosporella prunicola CBS 121167]KAF2136725.1 hypothetical protein K452DRAFT_236980 [Aplosporella prunicola CBS 121167]